MGRLFISPVVGEKYFVDVDSNCISYSDLSSLIELHDRIPQDHQRIIFNGKQIHRNTEEVILNDKIPSFVDIRLRIVGGKGGFGSLLRGGQPGTQKKKNTNYGACRDLNGRRIRHVKQEEELAKWNKEQEEAKNNGKPTKSKTDKLPTVEVEDLVTETSLISEMVASSVLEAFKKKEDEQNSQKRPLPDDLQEPPTKIQKTNETQEVHDTKNIDDSSQKEKNGKIDLDKYETDSLKALGMDKLKEQLVLRGLKCGGSLDQRVARLMAIKGKPKSEWDKKLLAKKN